MPDFRIDVPMLMRARPCDVAKLARWLGVRVRRPWMPRAEYVDFLYEVRRELAMNRWTDARGEVTT